MSTDSLRKKIIIDTDPGIDDAMAIFYALASGHLEVSGITTVFGNAPVDSTTRNALRLMEIAGREDIPVAAGAARPLAMPYRGSADFVHGSDGQGNTTPDGLVLRSKAVAERACDFIIRTVRSFPGEVTLVPLGPLTNIALALMLEPDIAADIREIVLMGGNAFGPGNATPTAEANILNDPEAADIVFGASCPVTMCGLDVTEKILMTGADIDRIGSMNTPQSAHLAAILPFYRAFYRTWLKVDGIYVHDSTTISWLLHPELFRTVQHPIRVDTSDGIGRGKTWPSRGTSAGEGPWQDRPKVNICVGVDGAAAVKYEMEHLGQCHTACV